VERRHRARSRLARREGGPRRASRDARPEAVLRGRDSDDDTGGMVEIVDPVENENFCANCGRVRVTHEGYLKGCLNATMTSGRWGDDPRRIAETFEAVVANRVPYYGEYLIEKRRRRVRAQRSIWGRRVRRIEGRSEVEFPPASLDLGSSRSNSTFDDRIPKHLTKEFCGSPSTTATESELQQLDSGTKYIEQYCRKLAKYALVFPTIKIEICMRYSLRLAYLRGDLYAESYRTIQIYNP